jgi:hypothetical protein
VDAPAARVSVMRVRERVMERVRERVREKVRERVREGVVIVKLNKQAVLPRSFLLQLWAAPDAAAAAAASRLLLC